MEEGQVTCFRLTRYVQELQHSSLDERKETLEKVTESERSELRMMLEEVKDGGYDLICVYSKNPLSLKIREILASIHMLEPADEQDLSEDTAAEEQSQ